MINSVVLMEQRPVSDERTDGQKTLGHSTSFALPMRRHRAVKTVNRVQSFGGIRGAFEVVISAVAIVVCMFWQWCECFSVIRCNKNCCITCVLWYCSRQAKSWHLLPSALQDNSKTTTVLRSLYKSTFISRHPQSRTERFCRSIFLLPACPCWRWLAHSD